MMFSSRTNKEIAQSLWSKVTHFPTIAILRPHTDRVVENIILSINCVKCGSANCALQVVISAGDQYSG